MNIFTVTFVVLLIFKLLEVITWSWWWVFSPLLFAGGFALFAIMVIALVAACSTAPVRRHPWLR